MIKQLLLILSFAILASCSDTQATNPVDSKSPTAKVNTGESATSVKKEKSTKEYLDHIEKLQKKIPDGFHIQLQKPFVVIGDESKTMVSLRSRRTVKWAVEMLKKDFFPKDPDEIVNIWLFKDALSYRKNALKLFRDRPTTPYGYYSPSHKAILMNISTGAGTLVHEIVHPFIESNFEDCPSWFNEGLASLYEACTEKGGKIHGMVNWRLKGLKEAINSKSLMSFEDLCATTTNEFYTSRSDKYAQARYLCYYLQEKKLLRKYYKEFTGNAKDDPTGYKSLKKVLGTGDMKGFQEKWEKWCLTLKK